MTQPPDEPGPAPAAEVEAEARRLMGLIVDQKLRVRLMGGLAIRIQSPSSSRPPYERSYGDLDLVSHGKDVGALRRLLEGQGYVSDKLFNAIHGAQRLVYSAADGRWTVDVVIDRLAMSHTIELKDRLATAGPTLDLADLLLTKLQIWEINRKDLGDAICLLADHPLVADRGARESIDLGRIRSVLGSDWGFCHTVERNLGRVGDQWAEAPVPEALYPVDAQISRLLEAIETAPKSLGWKARARIGERVRWSETPEEAKR